MYKHVKGGLGSAPVDHGQRHNLHQAELIAAQKRAC